MANSVLPATNLIPTTLTNAKCYRDGGDLLGIANIELPDFEYMTESMTGLGVMGEIEMPVIGHFKSMTVKLKWNTLTNANTALVLTERQNLDIRGSIQKADGGTGNIVNEPIKVLVLGWPKKSGVGKFEPGKKLEPETELEIQYLKIWLGGRELIEVDKLNFSFKVEGVEQMAEIRRNMGMQ